MKLTVELLSQALKMAEAAHAEYEKNTSKFCRKEWPVFYAEWLLKNTSLGDDTCSH